MRSVRTSICFGIIFLFTSIGIEAKPAGEIIVYPEIRGRIIDNTTQEPLVGVNVIVENTTFGATTNLQGAYYIPRVSAGRYSLVASMVGYKTMKKQVAIATGEVVVVDFGLETTILEMGAVVITGTATPHLYEDMPVRTEVIPHRLIEQKQARNLAEALSLQTGVRVENNCTNCNFTQVRILGMEGKYSQILIEGDPVVSSLTGVYGLEHIPQEMVGQIEIMKGGGSSLYGGGAVAGVINVITQRPVMDRIRLRYSCNSVEGLADQHVGISAEMVNDKGSAGAYIFGSARKRNPYDANGDGYSELGELKNESIGFNLYMKPIQSAELMTHFHRIHEERRGGNKFSQPVHEAEIAEWLEHRRWGGTVRWQHSPTVLLDYRAYYSFALQKRESYYGGLGGDTPDDRLDALSFYGHTDNPLHVAGGQVNFRLGHQLLTGGMQYSRDKVVDETAAETAYHIDDIYTDVGLFLQDDLHFGGEDEVELVLGARLDKHSEIDSWIISPRIHGKLEVGGGFTLRGALTTGFKAPQTYDEDLHLCGVGGDQRIIRNSADLKEERSLSYSGGIEFQGSINAVPLITSLTGFQTTLKDAFSEEFVSKEGVIESWRRVNSEGAKVRGVELDMGIRPAYWLEMRGGLTWQKSEYDRVNEDFGTRNFLRTPDLTGQFRISMDMAADINIFATGNYIGEADIPHEVAVEYQEDPVLLLKESKSFMELGLGLSYCLPLMDGIFTKCSVGIRNLTDAYQEDLDIGADRDPAYVYGPTLPRTFYVGLETSF